ncbi:MAG TPA: histidine phosphatase family protein [Chloroflexota bacterium]|nr:histidine phosphatase family protein [Chloroflexota bacterium]
MAATVLLVRHAESAWNRAGIYQGQKDTPLSPLGERQASLIASHLKSIPISGVLSSPLRRARAVASAVAAHHGLEPVLEPRLTEIAHGVWEGLSRHEVVERFPDDYHRWVREPHAVTFPGGESLSDVHRRAVPVIADVLARAGTWVVVTHDTVARLAIAAAGGRPLHGFTDVSLENAAISTLVGPDLLGSVRHVNSTAHLADARADLEGQAL